ncbi:MAG TPA: hypothetical protein VLR49_13160 [Ferruginibacter sp.]|nr:hypothetical protein [Ferruginibacter sp.]
MRLLWILLVLGTLSSCWPKIQPGEPQNNAQKVFGYKPVYGAETFAKKIIYANTPQPVVAAGNIYVKGELIYQVETGKGIHVIDNRVPAQAHRVGFLTINGSSEISINGNFLYTNSYDDLVVVDKSDINSISEVKRVKGAFPEGRNNYFYVQPPESGYYECPRFDSLVIGWKKDSVYAACYKN